MKIIITDSQYKFLLSEQSSPVKIGCHDYDKIGALCTTLVFPKAEADKLIVKYKPTADKEALESINSQIQKLLTMGGEEGKTIAEKFSSSINTSKTQISKILTQYYSQAVYASCGLGAQIDISKIILQICGVIYSNFIKAWNESWFYRNMANAAITQSNIKKVQSIGKEILNTVINEISSMVMWYYMDSASWFVHQRVDEMQKTTPKCSNVIIIQDRGCNPLPRNKWYSPNQGYKNIGFATPGSDTNPGSLAWKTYLPKLVTFLNELV